MELTQRAYLLLGAWALLTLLGLWLEGPWSGLWRWPLALLLAGLAWEGARLRKLRIEARVSTAQPACLGRPQPAQFEFEVDSSLPRPPHTLTLIYLPELPSTCAPLGGPRRLTLIGNKARDPFTLTPLRLGEEDCPRLSARVRGPLGLAFWPHRILMFSTLRITPGAPALRRHLPLGHTGGLRARRFPGSGEQLHQLRSYQRGDPLSRIDWKASARSGELISRDSSATPQRDLLIALDMGHTSRLTLAGGLERHALHASIAARLAQGAIAAQERAGLLLFADGPVQSLAPARGWAALARIRALLESTHPRPMPADPLAAALALRRLLRGPALIVLLTDLTEVPTTLIRLPDVLGSPHRLILAGACEPRIAALATAPARAPDDPWIALMAQEHLARAQHLQQQLRQRGCPVLSAPPDALEEAVLAAYAQARLSAPLRRGHSRPVSSAAIPSQ